MINIGKNTNFALFHFFHKKGTTRQPFFTFPKKALPASHFPLFPHIKALPANHFPLFPQKGTTRQPFSTFPTKRHYPPAIFHFFHKQGSTRQPFFSFHKDKDYIVKYPSTKSKYIFPFTRCMEFKRISTHALCAEQGKQSPVLSWYSYFVSGGVCWIQE